MLNTNKIIQKVIGCCLLILLLQIRAQAQTVTQPKWWFGFSGAANTNFYDGTTQRLNSSLIVPTAFHKGKGVRPFGSILLEYRPSQTWGGALNLGYDGRGGKFDDVIAPCDCPATLKSNVSYFTIEPTLRLNPFAGDFYIFAGPRIAFNLQKEFDYTQLKQTDKSGDLSEMRKTLFSGQVGVGYDIPVSSPDSENKFVISPFISYHPYFGQDVRKIESWSITTVRAGVAFKFGKGKKVKVVETTTTPISVLPEVNFSVTAPRAIVSKRMVSETLPLLNYVFFDNGSTEIPARYRLLSSSEAANFKEEQLQNEGTENLSGRSGRQMNVYYHVLNILGDRMRSNPSADITLTGSSMNGASEGKIFANHIKSYLVDVFGINGNRIAIAGRKKPVNPSEQPGGKKELTLLREGDRRVDIESTSSALMMEFGGGMMNPVLINATEFDSKNADVVLNIENGNEVLTSYTIDFTDQNGEKQQYGPFTGNQQSISGNKILGANKSGDYQVVMLGTTKNGTVVRKESTLNLKVQEQQMVENGLRYSILFNFDKANTVKTYQQFIVNVLVPLISDGSTVIIHGHTDVIGDSAYNIKLSELRAQEAKKLIENALIDAGKRNVKFEIYGFGEATDKAPFENKLPEERFYNRTVIIDTNLK